MRSRNWVTEPISLEGNQQLLWTFPSPRWNWLEHLMNIICVQFSCVQLFCGQLRKSTTQKIYSNVAIDVLPRIKYEIKSKNCHSNVAKFRPFFVLPSQGYQVRQIFFPVYLRYSCYIITIIFCNTFLYLYFMDVTSPILFYWVRQKGTFKRIRKQLLLLFVSIRQSMDHLHFAQALPTDATLYVVST